MLQLELGGIRQNSLESVGEFLLDSFKINIRAAVIDADSMVFPGSQIPTDCVNIVLPQLIMPSPAGTAHGEISFANLPAFHQPVGQIIFGAKAIGTTGFQ